jgi:hypothetical protein
MSKLRIVLVAVDLRCLTSGLKGRGFSRAVQSRKEMGFGVCVRSRFADSEWNEASGFLAAKR